MTTSHPQSYRHLCTRCLRSESVCYCADITPFETNCRFVILQHPRERRNTIGTARLTHLFLKNSKLIVGGSFDQDEEVNAILNNPDLFSVVLYPGTDSISIESETIPNGDKTLVIFVIDGTWAQAKTMLRRSPKLNLIPKICFHPTTPSLYTVRRQPHAYCLSTIEATQRLIQILDPKAPSQALIQIFTRLVDFQIECGKRNELREAQL